MVALKRASSAGLTLAEVVVTIAVVAGLILLVVPLTLRHPHEVSRRKSCNSNLIYIARACTFYQEPNGDFFPAHSQYDAGTTDRFLPMPSLAALYPEYIDSAKVFACTETKDRPFISMRRDKGIRWTCFGTDQRKDLPASNPVRYSGSELATDRKCSYLYDERSHFRLIGPDTAMAADADGQAWLDPTGKPPPYPAAWTRLPRKPNHENGQNVMYFDGHIKWSETNYAVAPSRSDNIFCPNGRAADKYQWDPDTDCYLWDGVNARQIEWSTK